MRYKSFQWLSNHGVRAIILRFTKINMVIVRVFFLTKWGIRNQKPLHQWVIRSSLCHGSFTTEVNYQARWVYKSVQGKEAAQKTCLTSERRNLFKCFHNLRFDKKNEWFVPFNIFHFSFKAKINIQARSMKKACKKKKYRWLSRITLSWELMIFYLNETPD